MNLPPKTRYRITFDKFWAPEIVGSIKVRDGIIESHETDNLTCLMSDWYFSSFATQVARIGGTITPLPKEKRR